MQLSCISTGISSSDRNLRDECHIDVLPVDQLAARDESGTTVCLAVVQILEQQGLIICWGIIACPGSDVRSRFAGLAGREEGAAGAGAGAGADKLTTGEPQICHLGASGCVYCAGGHC